MSNWWTMVSWMGEETVRHIMFFNVRINPFLSLSLWTRFKRRGWFTRCSPSRSFCKYVYIGKGAKVVEVVNDPFFMYACLGGESLYLNQINSRLKTHHITRYSNPLHIWLSINVMCAFLFPKVSFLFLFSSRCSSEIYPFSSISCSSPAVIGLIPLISSPFCLFFFIAAAVEWQCGHQM